MRFPGRRKKRAQSRLRRWTKRILVTLGVLVALLVAGALGFLYNLDAPAVKRRVVAIVHDQAGLDIDYAHASFELRHGLALTDVIVRQPPSLRSIAPDLAKASLVSVGWSGLRLERASATDLTFTVAIDEAGRTSFDELAPPGPHADEEPTTPLSQRGRLTRELAPKLPTAVIERATVIAARRVVVEGAPTIERTMLDGVTLHVEPKKEAGTWHVRARLGTPNEPLALRVRRFVGDASRGEARTKLWLEADATEMDLHAALELMPGKQTFASELEAASSQSLRAEAAAHFEPSAKTTHIGVPRIVVGDGVADLSASLDVPDAGAPKIRHAHGAIDFVRLLALVPPGLLPVHVRVGEGRIDFDVAELALDQLPKLSEGAKVAAIAKLAAVEVEEAKASKAEVSFHVVPGEDDSLHATAKIALDDGRRADMRGENLALDVDATQTKAGKLSGKVNIGFDRMTASGMAARKGSVTADTKELDPETGRGEVIFTTDIESLSGNGVAVPVRARAHVTELDARAATGAAVVDLDAKDSHVHLEAARTASAFDYTLEGSLPLLDPIRAFLPKGLALSGATVKSSGHVDTSGESLRHHTEVRAKSVTFAPYANAGALALELDAHGTADVHVAKGTLDVSALHLAGGDTADEHIDFDVALDRPGQKLDVKLEENGHARSKLTAKLAVDRANAVHYDVALDVGKLKPLASYLGIGLDLEKLEVGVKSKGTLTGVVGAKSPAKTAAIDGNVDIRAKNVAMSSAELAFSIPEATISSVLGSDGDKRTVKSKVRIERAKLSNRMHSFSVGTLTDEITAGITGDLTEPEITSRQKLALEDLKQDLLPMYVVGDAKLDIVARRSADGVIHVASLDLVNTNGGTAVALKGAIDPNEPQRLSFKGTVEQDLSKMSHAPELMRVKGSLKVALDVESPDLTVFRTNADVGFQDLDLHLPASMIHVEGANGQVPVTASIRIDKRGATLLRENDNPYAALRFADQHPLLNRSSFLNVKKLSLPQNGKEGVVVISPLVGNFQVVHNIFTLRQFEMGFRGGRVTGQAALDWNWEKSVVDLRVRADHVRSSHGEPFTGSASVIVSAADHNIEGRADILQIGDRHLHDILDLEDPFHTDPSINKIRTALKFGYPDKVRIGFKRGFASAHIELGGLAWLFSIDDLKGLPIGPVIDRYLGPIFPTKVESRLEAAR